MCGIAGFAGEGDLAVLRRMTAAIAHRGPDAEGHWSDEANGVFLGHRRLSIVDLAGGAQPMWTADGEIGVTFNGEIFNHQALRAELKSRGCVFTTDHSDTEVLLHGYRVWGDAFVERLSGQWAFAIYDRPRRRLFCSRDRFGKKPFYYFHEAGVFGFASELPALLPHPAAPRSLSSLSLQKYFAYGYVPAPRSIFERIWKLPGGHSLSFDLGARELRVWRYWEFLLEPDDSLLAAVREDRGGPDFAHPRIDSLCEEIRATLERSVVRRLMSDVPLGVFLSGGIDSSAVAALAARHVPPGALNTFSIGFNEPSFDESEFAALIAARIGSRHRQETLDLDKSVSLLPDIVSRLDEPLGDGSLLPTYLLSQFTRKHVTVALGGDGGDELFAGYDPFKALGKAAAYARLVPRPVHQAIRLLAARLPVSHQNMSLDFKIKRTLVGLSHPPRLWHPVWMGALEPRELGELFADPAKTEEVYSEAIEAWDRFPGLALPDRALQFWTRLYLPDDILAKVDRASMLCALEARSPFLDVEMADVARRIPWQLKLRQGRTKWILKRALEPLLPAEIIHRKKKGFGMPIGRWLREGRFHFDETAPPPFRGSAFTARKLQNHLANRSDERLYLWSAWIFQEWNRAVTGRQKIV
jgi:asparagine synthase (glutamine-hydrolysing)